MVVSKTMTATVMFAASNKSIRGVGNGTRITRMLEISPKGRTKFCQADRRFMLANGVFRQKGVVCERGLRRNHTDLQTRGEDY